jgi:hypothetical protein
MTKTEAERIAHNYNKHDTMYATVERILPDHVDPIKPNDNGWDVKVQYLPDFVEWSVESDHNVYED